MPPEVRLDIFSDPVCPWCWIGKRLLDRALEAAPDHPFRLEWHPFRLTPDMPPGGIDRRLYLETKFGSQQAAVAALLPAVKAAEAAGLPLNLAAITRQPDTTDAHRLIHWAGLEGLQTPVVDALFTAALQQGRDIGHADTLTEIGARAGLDAPLLARLLASDADRDAILAREAHARARGITGVPTFILADTHVLTGAQPTALWREVIAELTGQTPAQPVPGPDNLT